MIIVVHYGLVRTMMCIVSDEAGRSAITMIEVFAGFIIMTFVRPTSKRMELSMNTSGLMVRFTSPDTL
jgi:hypothetical protein